VEEQREKLHAHEFRLKQIGERTAELHALAEGIE
jgi:hypothetical protein